MRLALPAYSNNLVGPSWRLFQCTPLQMKAWSSRAVNENNSDPQRRREMDMRKRRLREVLYRHFFKLNAQVNA